MKVVKCYFLSHCVYVPYKLNGSWNCHFFFITKKHAHGQNAKMFKCFLLLMVSSILCGREKLHFLDCCSQSKSVLIICACEYIVQVAITFWIIDGSLFFATFIFHFLWSSVCGISIWTKQQWDVVMRCVVFNFKYNLRAK